jgi:hypothetical protein
MAWNNPKTWADNELVTATLLNQQLRDNLAFLKQPSQLVATSTGTGSNNTSAWVNIASQILTVNLNAAVRMAFYGTISVASNEGKLRFFVDNNALGPEVLFAAGSNKPVCMIARTDPLSAGGHQLDIRYHNNTSTSISYNGYFFLVAEEL